jgi:hypothetical protein
MSKQLTKELSEIYARMTDPEARKKEEIKKKREEKRKQTITDYL